MHPFNRCLLNAYKSGSEISPASESPGGLVQPRLLAPPPEFLICRSGVGCDDLHFSKFPLEAEGPVPHFEHRWPERSYYLFSLYRFDFCSSGRLSS